jgi:hypothetical protein
MGKVDFGNALLSHRDFGVPLYMDMGATITGPNCLKENKRKKSFSHPSSTVEV